MGLLKLFRDLITEHGSAKIQTKHIALLKEQLLINSQETLILKTEKQKLETENQILKTENENLKQENITLKEKIDKTNKTGKRSVSQCSIIQTQFEPPYDKLQ
jgi:hypothetical protein